tara:strand:- start:1252 stop:1827 length:576 start_codon:yes stop_codon:yes gene_type:complete
MLEILIDKGICVGALVGLADHEWDSKLEKYVDVVMPAVITAIRWDAINFNATIASGLRMEVAIKSDRVILAERLMKNQSGTAYEALTLPYDDALTLAYRMQYNKTDSPDWHEGHSVLSPISGHVVLSTAPRQFLGDSQSYKFVDGWLDSDPHSENKRKKRSRCQVKFEYFVPLLGKTACLAQKDVKFYGDS